MKHIIYYLTRKDGRYFTGPGQLESFRWSRHLYDAKPFNNLAEAKGVMDAHSEVEGIAIIEREGPHREFEPGKD